MALARLLHGRGTGDHRGADQPSPKRWRKGQAGDSDWQKFVWESRCATSTCLIQLREWAAGTLVGPGLIHSPQEGRGVVGTWGPWTCQRALDIMLTLSLMSREFAYCTLGLGGISHCDEWDEQLSLLRAQVWNISYYIILSAQLKFIERPVFLYSRNTHGAACSYGKPCSKTLVMQWPAIELKSLCVFYTWVGMTRLYARQVKYSDVAW